MTKQDYTKSPANETTEEWRDIPGWEGIYQISDRGRCKRIANGSDGRRLPERILKAKAMGWKNQYLAYRLTWENNTTMMFAHRAVLSAFVGNPPTDIHQCNHKDGIKHNNYPENLEWTTPKENQQHRYNELDQSQNGILNGSNKYPQEKIQQILDLYQSGKYTQRRIAEMTSIDYRYVNAIVHGRAWKHLKD